jgi:nitrogen fixation NifU-like protein
VTGGDNPAGGLARLYRDAIRQHSSNPVGYRRDIDATHRHEEYNPQCGDRIDVLLRIAGERVEAAAFEGEACAICMASASLLCSLAPGRTVSELKAMGAGLQEALNEPVGAAVGAALAAIGSDDSQAKQSRLKPLLQESPSALRADGKAAPSRLKPLLQESPSALRADGKATPSRLKPLLQESLSALRADGKATPSRLKPPPQPLLHPDLHPLLGVRPYPSRVRCATLPWSAAWRALAG